MAVDFEVGDVIRVTVKLTYQLSDAVQNVFHIKNVGVTTIPESVFATQVRGVFDDIYDDVALTQSDEITPDRIELFNITKDQPMTDLFFSSYTGGVGSSPTLPLQCSPLVSFGTSFAKSTGRKYFGIPTEAGTTGGGELTAAVIANLASAGAQMITNKVLTAGTFRFGNYRAVGAVFIPWVSAAVDALLRTQRRRVQGVGS